ncbi:glycoside hydrolase family 43 protein [Paenibacillus turpanensis]|uniref:glycoside hydrolase family 43 protein n=1 Tax=Paenibacillus turpanensis TaxID=2689078 RepID=UPI001A9EC5BA|nr:glycoside hydrolase family 43 protein [Paenibacillus turpanensis]
MKLSAKDIQIRDPFVVPIEAEGNYYLFGSTDRNVWGKGTGFDAYVSKDLESWEGPFPVFRPDETFFAENHFWAPEVYVFGDKYYMFATFRRKTNNRLGTAVLVSDHILGPYTLYSDGPVTPQDWDALDGTLYMDEEGQPWMVFCHEWQQIIDGEICAVRLAPDLRSTMEEPITLFRASEAPWTTPVHPQQVEGDVYVTDGPFLMRTESGELFMLWASFREGRYALGIARSESGSVKGPWVHEAEPFYQDDGGHGMIFRTFDGRLMVTIHAPNKTPEERPYFFEVTLSGGALKRASSEE